MKQERFVPLEKQSKRKRREHFSAQRNDWNGVTPVTKMIPNKKKPNRRSEKAQLRLELC